MTKTTVQILPGFFLTAAVAILLIPLPWLFAWMVAAAVHEVFHLLAVYIFRYSVISVTVGAAGAKIETNMPQGLQMTACALAGPLGGLFLLLLLRYAPRVALCGLIQSLYNLLPLCHLDGGRALYGLLTAFVQPNTAQQIIVIVERVIIILLVVAALYAALILHLGVIPLTLVTVLLFRNKKYLAKKVP